MHAGVDLDMRDSRGWSAATCAANRGHVSTLKMLHRNATRPSGNIIDDVVQQEFSISFGQTPGVCADLSRPDALGNTAATWAGCLGHAHVIRELATCVDLRTQDSWGNTCAHWAASRGHASVLRQLGQVRVMQLQNVSSCEKSVY
jgi:ankyrin repeat protein